MTYWRECRAVHAPARHRRGSPTPRRSCRPGGARLARGQRARRSDPRDSAGARHSSRRHYARAASSCGLAADSSDAARPGRRSARPTCARAAADPVRDRARRDVAALAGPGLARWPAASCNRSRTPFEAQRQFVANASHELRAPLTRQRALIQVALADPDASFSSLRAAHERVLASEQHLEQMIDALLTLTRGQAGLERRERLDLATLASQALLAREPELAGTRPRCPTRRSPQRRRPAIRDCSSA